MTRSNGDTATRPGPDSTTIVQAVTVIMGTVVGLTFLFGFGNVLNLALRLGVPIWVAPLVAPAVDLSILGLLLGTRHLALHGATPNQLRPARRLLIFASIATLALNIADPLATGAYGKAAFDAVGPLLLIGWAEVGPGLLQAIGAINTQVHESAKSMQGVPAPEDQQITPVTRPADPEEMPAVGHVHVQRGSNALPEDLLARARQEDTAHRATHQKPISADTLRRRLRIGATRSRQLVAVVRSEAHAEASKVVDDADEASEVNAVHAA